MKKTRNSTPEVKYAIGNESQSVTIKKESDEISKFRLLEEKVKKKCVALFLVVAPSGFELTSSVSDSSSVVEVVTCSFSLA